MKEIMVPLRASVLNVDEDEFCNWVVSDVITCYMSFQTFEYLLILLYSSNIIKLSLNYNYALQIIMSLSLIPLLKNMYISLPTIFWIKQKIFLFKSLWKTKQYQQYERNSIT